MGSSNFGANSRASSFFQTWIDAGAYCPCLVIGIVDYMPELDSSDAATSWASAHGVFGASDPYKKLRIGSQRNAPPPSVERKVNTEAELRAVSMPQQPAASQEEDPELEEFFN